MNWSESYQECAATNKPEIINGVVLHSKNDTQGYADTPRSSRCPGQRDRQSDDVAGERGEMGEEHQRTSELPELWSCHVLRYALPSVLRLLMPQPTAADAPHTRSRAPRSAGTGPGYPLPSNENRNRISTVLWQHLMRNYLIAQV